jgi:hypothetical protein
MGDVGSLKTATFEVLRLLMLPLLILDSLNSEHVQSLEICIKIKISFIRGTELLAPLT